MGARSTAKGKRGEREVVALARAAGLSAARTWHTAQSPDARERCSDVRIGGRPAQVKIAADGFGALYNVLDGVEIAFVRADRREWLAVLPAEVLLRLLKPQAVASQAAQAVMTEPGFGEVDRVRLRNGRRRSPLQAWRG